MQNLRGFLPFSLLCSPCTGYFQLAHRERHHRVQDQPKHIYNIRETDGLSTGTKSEDLIECLSRAVLPALDLYLSPAGARIHTEEFYQVTDCSWRLPELNRELRRWEHIYNCVRPHQALGYLTLLQFLQQWRSQRN